MSLCQGEKVNRGALLLQSKADEAIMLFLIMLKTSGLGWVGLGYLASLCMGQVTLKWLYCAILRLTRQKHCFEHVAGKRLGVFTVTLYGASVNQGAMLFL